MGVPSAPLGHHVPGGYAYRRARADGRLCTPADHGAGAEAAVVHVGEVVSECGAEEGGKGGPNVLVETVGDPRSSRASGEKEKGMLQEEDICGRRARGYESRLGLWYCG